IAEQADDQRAAEGRRDGVDPCFEQRVAPHQAHRAGEAGNRQHPRRDVEQHGESGGRHKRPETLFEQAANVHGSTCKPESQSAITTPMPMLSDSRKASAPRATPETRSLLLKSRTDVISGTPGTISRTDAASACWGRGASSNGHRIAAVSAATNEQTTVNAKALTRSLP